METDLTQPEPEREHMEDERPQEPGTVGDALADDAPADEPSTDDEEPSPE